MSYYQEDGYIDFRKIFTMLDKWPFGFLIGARAIGKTFGSLFTAREREQMFMYMRRLQSETDMINKPDFSPFRAINRVKGTAVESRIISKNSVAYHDTHDSGDGKIFHSDMIGLSCALTTLAGMRGFDASPLDVLIYDEFIPEKHVKPIRNEAVALLNAYETIARNRELEGRKPLKLLCMANSDDISAPIFLELGIVSKLEKMALKRQETFVDEKRGIFVINFQNSPISLAKMDTALYRLTRGNAFSEMAIGNDFHIDRQFIESRSLREFFPLVTLGEVTIYKHKSERSYYVSEHRSGSVPEYDSSDRGISQYKRAFPYLWTQYLNRNFTFESVLCEIVFTKYYKV